MFRFGVFLSIKLMTAVWELGSLPPTTKLVLLSLCDHANDSGESCYPSIKSIADKSSLSERQVQRLIRQLISCGAISVTRNAKGGRGVTPHYKINVDLIKKGDIMSSFKKGDMDDAERVTPVTEKGDVDVTLTINKPSASQLAAGNERSIDPPECEDEILPSSWHTFAEQLNIPDEQIYKSWRKFKQITSWPMQFNRWKSWVRNERLR